MRNHRLRERRLKLGATQFLIGCLAGWPPRSAQTTVSAVERGIAKSADSIRRVRAALLYLETEPRRRRALAREEAEHAAILDTAILLNREPVIVDSLVDLLWDGRTDEFDAAAARVDARLVDRAVDEYLDSCKPKVG